MDVGCGDGKLLQQLGRRARKVNCQLRLVGCDFSSRALAMCQRAADTNGVSIELYEVDVMRDPLPVTADIIINSLFLHHFSDNQVVELLGKIRHSARRLIVIEDLVRSQIGYILCWIGVHVLTRSPVVHTDGPLSVKAAFTHSELRQLLAMAELENASCSRHWPERLLIHWTPDSRSGHER
jgi:2-polyprenyl-3-methyl-5-hydroxy-6-metoxy-1,4-benzoquinol methylase